MTGGYYWFLTSRGEWVVAHYDDTDTDYPITFCGTDYVLSVAEATEDGGTFGAKIDPPETIR